MRRGGKGSNKTMGSEGDSGRGRVWLVRRRENQIQRSIVQTEANLSDKPTVRNTVIQERKENKESKKVSVCLYVCM